MASLIHPAGAAPDGDRIRERVESLMLRAPQMFLYIRADRDRRCSCYSSFTVERADWHEECFGLGFQVRVELQPGRRFARPVEERDLVPLGQISQTHPILYFPEWVRPKENDLVVEAFDWEYGFGALDTVRIYTVMIALPMVQREVSFYSCGCNPYDVDRSRVIQAVREKQVYAAEVVHRLLRARGSVAPAPELWRSTAPAVYRVVGRHHLGWKP